MRPISPFQSPFQLMKIMFSGLALSLLYSITSASLVYLVEGKSEAQNFLKVYNEDFKTLLSLGLIIGTAVIVYKSQSIVPDIIQRAFTKDQLLDTKYFLYRERYFSARRSMEFAGEFLLASFLLFNVCQFPLRGLAEALMMVPSCAIYAIGVYIGRKMCYAGMMLHSLLGVPPARNLFKDRELDDINNYVHMVSTLMIVFGYMHIIGYGYNKGPYLFQSILGEGAKTLLFLPALVATPVLLIFNFYPRVVLRKVYDQSIKIEIRLLQKALQSEKISPFEKRSYLLEFDRMSREELRYGLQLTLGDLPIGITLVVMLWDTFLSK